MNHSTCTTILPIVGDWVLTRTDIRHHSERLNPVKPIGRIIPANTLGHVTALGNGLVVVDFGEGFGVKAVHIADIKVLDLPDLAQSPQDVIADQLVVIIASQHDTIMSQQATLTEQQTEITRLVTERDQAVAVAEGLETQLRGLADELVHAPSRLAAPPRVLWLELPVEVDVSEQGWILAGEKHHPETQEVVALFWSRDGGNPSGHGC